MIYAHSQNIHEDSVDRCVGCQLFLKEPCYLFDKDRNNKGEFVET